MKTDVTQPDVVPGTSLPRISYTSATRARFVWQNEVHVVGTCDLVILQAFLSHFGGLALADKPYKLEEAMQCLDFETDLGRWQAIDVLLFYRVMLPLL